MTADRRVGDVAAPWYGPHHGKAGVTDFFRALATTMTVQRFEPISITWNDDDDQAVVAYETPRVATGRSVTMSLHHLFRFRDGKIAFVRSAEDTCQMEALFRD